MSSIVIFLNALMGVITDGTYPIRFLLFVLYVLLVVIVAYCVQKPHAHSLRIRIATGVAVGSFVSLFLASFILERMVFSNFDIPHQSLVLLMDGDEITGTRLVHAHISKSGLAIIPGVIDLFAARADTGDAARAFLPSYAPYGIAFLFMGALGATVYLAGVVTAKARRRSVAALLYALVTFVLLEKSIDGGIASDATALAFMAFLFLLVLPVERFQRGLAYAVLAQVWLLTLLYIHGFYWPDAQFGLALARNAWLALTLAALHTLAYGSTLPGKRAVPSIVCCAVAVGLMTVYLTQTGWNYIHTPIPPSSFLAAYAWEARPAIPQAGTIGRLAVYDAESLRGQSVGEVTDAYALPYWYRPISTSGETCFPMSTNVVREHFIVLSPVALRDVVAEPASLASASFVLQPNAPAGWFRYQGTILLTPCVLRRVDVVRELVRLAGSERAVIYDLRYGGPATSQVGAYGVGDKVR